MDGLGLWQPQAVHETSMADPQVQQPEHHSPMCVSAWHGLLVRLSNQICFSLTAAAEAAAVRPGSSTDEQLASGAACRACGAARCRRHSVCRLLELSFAGGRGAASPHWHQQSPQMSRDAGAGALSGPGSGPEPAAAGPCPQAVRKCEQLELDTRKHWSVESEFVRPLSIHVPRTVLLRA